uniref:DUF1618 domain-containing protein n=1 Tax=Setaria italica TaxID=4555 RepID=K4ABZ2_SETIT
MAAAARRPAPIFLLSGQVDMGALTDEPGGGGWTEIECASRKAYGCGEHGQEAAEGLKLYVRLGAGPLLTSSLDIRMSDEALRRFDSELEISAPSKDMRPRPMQAEGVVQMAEEEDLTVIFLLFCRPFRLDLTYYLVYDHVGASLSMINYLSDLYLPTGTMKPVPKRRGSDFELFLMTSRLQLPRTPPPVLFVCTPEARANPASDDGIDVAFSFQGKGFWSDLSRGLVYCDLHTTSDTAVDFGFIRLPRECLEQMGKDNLKLIGTMACVRDSIWLVCIHNAAESAADDLVKIWTLNVPDGGKWQQAWWEEVEEVPVSVLWGLDSFKEAGLPQRPLECPILTPDGTPLCHAG